MVRAVEDAVDEDEDEVKRGIWKELISLSRRDTGETTDVKTGGSDEIVMATSSSDV